MPKEGWIPWTKSVARSILLEDLSSPDGILFRKDHITPEQAWEFYKEQPGFKNEVVFSQFKERLKGHRKQVNLQYTLSQKEQKALDHDRQIHPRQPKNKRGQLVFDLHPAKKFLRQDVIDGQHEGKTPSQFQATRTVYQQFDPAIFKQRIYQEVRRKKWLHYLDQKRDVKKSSGPSPF